MAKPPDDGSQLSILSKTEVNSQLSNTFKQVTQNFNVSIIKERLLSADELHDNTSEGMMIVPENIENTYEDQENICYNQALGFSSISN